MSSLPTNIPIDVQTKRVGFACYNYGDVDIWFVGEGAVLHRRASEAGLQKQLCMEPALLHHQSHLRLHGGSAAARNPVRLLRVSCRKSEEINIS